MNKSVWIILIVAFMLLGLFDASNYFNTNDNPGTDVGTPQFYEFWGFIVLIAIGGALFWYRKRRQNR